MTQALSKAERATLLYGQIEGAELTLPDHIDRDRFVKMVRATIAANPDILEATPRSVVLSCIKAASDGLFLDGREAALIVRSVKVSRKGEPDRYEKQATYQPMVQGLMKLARNSGQIASITAQVIFQNDEFKHVLGDEERIEHTPAPLDVDPGKPIGVYAIVRLTDGTVVREVMRRTAVMGIAAQGKNAWQYDPAKGPNFGEWWRKTVIRRITKYIPRSTELQLFHDAAGRIDELVDFRQDGQPAGEVRLSPGAAALQRLTQQQPVEEEVEEIEAEVDEVTEAEQEVETNDQV